MPSLFQVNEELKIQPKDLFAIPLPEICPVFEADASTG